MLTVVLFIPLPYSLPESQRPRSGLGSSSTNCSTSEDSDRKGKSGESICRPLSLVPLGLTRPLLCSLGSTALRTSPPSSSWSPSPSTTCDCTRTSRSYVLSSQPLASTSRRALISSFLFTAQNRMQEALTLFDSICNSRWFVRTSIVSPPSPFPCRRIALPVEADPMPSRLLHLDPLPQQDRSVRREAASLAAGGLLRGSYASAVCLARHPLDLADSFLFDTYRTTLEETITTRLARTFSTDSFR